MPDWIIIADELSAAWEAGAAFAAQGWKTRAALLPGVDFDGAAIEAGRQKYGLDLAVGDFQTAPVPEGAFDAVTMSHVIEHVPDPGNRTRLRESFLWGPLCWITYQK